GVSQQLLALATPAAPPTTPVPGAAIPSSKGPAPGATVTSIAINRHDPFKQSSQQQLVVTGIFSDGSPRKITGQVKWRSSDEDLVKVAPGGMAKVAQGAGDVAITAELDREDGRPGKLTDSVTVKIRYPLDKIIVTP